MIAPLGEMLPAGEATARAVYDALADMAWRGEAVVEEAGIIKEADGLTISFHVDAMSACEENADQVCDALADVSSLRVRPHDEETFWFEVSIPCVFPEGDSEIKLSLSINDEKCKAYEDIPMPDWLADVLKAVKEERTALSIDDFQANYDQIRRLADLYGAIKELSKYISASFEFTKPNPPKNLHGGVHMKVHGAISLDKAKLAALITVLKTSRSLSVSNTDDGHVYLSFWVNNVYQPKE